jgi:hypothetical protein
VLNAPFGKISSAINIYERNAMYVNIHMENDLVKYIRARAGRNIDLGLAEVLKNDKEQTF